MKNSIYRKSTSTQEDESKTSNVKATIVEYLPMNAKLSVDQKYMLMTNMKEKILVSEPVPI